MTCKEDTEQRALDNNARKECKQGTQGRLTTFWKPIRARGEKKMRGGTFLDMHSEIQVEMSVHERG